MYEYVLLFLALLQIFMATKNRGGDSKQVSGEMP